MSVEEHVLFLPKMRSVILGLAVRDGTAGKELCGYAKEEDNSKAQGRLGRWADLVPPHWR